VQEYKVTRFITSRQQYRNFNNLLNSYRIDRAERIFNDSDSHHLSIATIAYDCGFNSLGPFNRAFREYTGMTLREFRQK
jgi:AraC-like DNA-binding protein